MFKQSRFWVICLASLVVAQTAASLFLPKRSFALSASSDIIQFTLLLCATVLCLANASNKTGRSHLFWLLMALGMGSWLAYQFLWTYIEVVRKHEVPNLFAGDIILFLHFVPMMAALALQPDVQQDQRELRLGVLDFTLLLFWWVYLYVYSVIPWQYVSANSAGYNHNLNFAYLFEKVAFLAGASLLWYRSSGSWKNIYAHWFGASLLYSSSSFVANWALDHNRYYSGSTYDLPLVASMAWMSVPGILGLRNGSQQTTPERSLPRGLWTARVGMLAVFSLPIFGWLAFIDHSAPMPVRSFRLGLTLGAIIFMGALVFTKQHFLDIELMRSLQSSRQAFQDLQLLQAQVVQSEKLASLGNLVGGAAHELNNPLTAMLGYSELLSNTELTNEQRALSDKISQQAKRIRMLVSSLLSFAKQVPATKSAIDVNGIVETAIKISRLQLDAAKVECSIELGSSLPAVRGDSNQLLKVFTHILNNAAHAMAEQGGGVLTVNTSFHSPAVIIEISDTGPGLREPAKVFDPFYTTRPVGQGTGLGLSMCYGIVEGHGGKISCRNRERGASFLVELPAIEAQNGGKAQAHAVKL